MVIKATTVAVTGVGVTTVACTRLEEGERVGVTARWAKAVSGCGTQAARAASWLSWAERPNYKAVAVVTP